MVFHVNHTQKKKKKDYLKHVKLTELKWVHVKSDVTLNFMFGCLFEVIF